jgi:uncharacterized protein
MFRRSITAKLEKSLTRSPIVLLTGARQTGKTTLVKEIGQKKGYYYVTFDDLRFLSLAQSDPIGFITSLPKPVILDVVQRAPDIFLTIKKDIDENRIPGRYLLTGSANPLMIPRLSDAFVGRMEVLTLYPFSQGELHNHTDQFIDAAFSKEKPAMRFEMITKKELLHRIIIGGYPLVQNVDSATREAWINSYITTILERDMKDLAQISGLAEFPNLLRLLAVRAGNLLNTAELSRFSGISATTLSRYLALLQALFIVHFQQPWYANLSKRLVRAPKTYFVDSGILFFLLGINIDRFSFDPQLMGGILENFVLEELRKQATWCNTRVQLYHFRSVDGIEVDILMEDAAGNIVGIEIKSSETVMPDDFKGLRYLQEQLGKKFVRGYVFYTGNEHIPFSPHLYALPISALWGA